MVDGFRKPRSLHDETQYFWKLTRELSQAKAANKPRRIAYALGDIHTMFAASFSERPPALVALAWRTIEVNVGTLAELKEAVSEISRSDTRRMLSNMWRLVPAARWGDAQMRRLALECIMAMRRAADRPYAFRGACGVISHLKAVGVLPDARWSEPVVRAMNSTGVVDLRSLKPSDRVSLLIDRPVSYLATQQIGKGYSVGDGLSPRSRWWLYLDQPMYVAEARRIVKILDRDGPPTKDRYPVKVAYC